MNLQLHHNKFAKHPVSFEQICEHVRNPGEYKDEDFNLDLVNLIGKWLKEVET